MWPFRRASRSHTPPRARLQLEALDLRLAPSYTSTGTYNPNPDFETIPVVIGQNAAPRIVNFVAVETGLGMWTFSGDVIDETPGGLTVTFGGMPESLQGQTTVTLANGHFVVAFELKTDGTDNGTVTAQTVDGGGLASNVAIYTINPG